MSTDLEARVRDTFERHLDRVDADVDRLLPFARARVARRARLRTGVAVAAAAAALAGAVGLVPFVRDAGSGVAPVPGSSTTEPTVVTSPPALDGHAGTWYLKPGPQPKLAPRVVVQVDESTGPSGQDVLTWSTEPCGLSGTLELVGNRVVVAGTVASDPPLCQPAELEQSTADDWGAARSLVLSEGELVLRDAEGRPVAVFTRTPPS